MDLHYHFFFNVLDDTEHFSSKRHSSKKRKKHIFQSIKEELSVKLPMFQEFIHLILFSAFISLLYTLNQVYT
jgi:hypothetical protein